ncbi:unnamed protein product, partial [Closterium sp. NIES-54]
MSPAIRGHLTASAAVKPLGSRNHLVSSSSSCFFAGDRRLLSTANHCRTCGGSAAAGASSGAFPSASARAASAAEAENDNNPMCEWLHTRTAHREQQTQGSGFNAVSYNEDESVRDGEGATWREECGLVGIWGDPDAGRLCYLALHALQHRGQEGAGIVTCSGNGRLRSVTGMGLVGEVFDSNKLAELEGSSGIGHVRYATA